jgi:long-subunit acyl-CoA synthetase (AMP-forming)
VGIPFPGVTVGVFDKDGKELPYGEKGELWIKSPSMASGYYGNEELTRSVFCDGWVHSNDMAEIDKDGNIYIYGRMKQHVNGPDGEPIYLFDIANEIRQDPAMKSTMACIVNGDVKHPHVVLHLILNDDCQETELQVLTRIENHMREWLPKGFKIDGYKFHKGMFVSRLAGKLDRMYYESQVDGYKLPVDGKLKDVSFPDTVK